MAVSDIVVQPITGTAKGIVKGGKWGAILGSIPGALVGGGVGGGAGTVAGAVVGAVSIITGGSFLIPLGIIAIGGALTGAILGGVTTALPGAAAGAAGGGVMGLAVGSLKGISRFVGGLFGADHPKNDSIAVSGLRIQSDATDAQLADYEQQRAVQQAEMDRVKVERAAAQASVANPNASDTHTTTLTAKLSTDKSTNNAQSV